MSNDMPNQSVTNLSGEWTNETMFNQSVQTMIQKGTDQWTQYQVIVSIVLGSISTTTVLTNTLVLVLFFKSKKALRLPSHILLANLGCADLLVGLIVMPIFGSVTVAKNHRWYWGKEICWAFDYIHFLLCATSMFSMVLVTVERYIGVRYPLRHKSIVSKSRAFKAAGSCWILAFLLTAIPLTIWPQEQSYPTVCIMNLNPPFLMFISFAVYWIPVSLAILLYAFIFFYALKPFVNLRRHGSSLPSKFSGNLMKNNTIRNQPQDKEDKFVDAKNRQISLAKKLALFVFAMLVMFGPLFFTFMLKGLKSELFVIKVLVVAGWVRYCNSCVNPFIFAFAVPGYKREFYRIFLNEGKALGDDYNDSMASSSSESSNKEKGKQKVVKPKSELNQEANKPRGNSNSNDLVKPMSLPKTPKRFCTYCGTRMTQADFNQLGVNNPCYCIQCFRKFASGEISFENSIASSNKTALDEAEKENSSCIAENSGNSVEQTLMFEIHKFLKAINDKKPIQKNMQPDSTGEDETVRGDSLVSRLMEISPEGTLCLENKSGEIIGIRNKIISPIIKRRSELLSAKPQPHSIDWDSIKELDEIIFKLDKTIFGPGNVESDAV